VDDGGNGNDGGGGDGGDGGGDGGGEEWQWPSWEVDTAPTSGIVGYEIGGNFVTLRPGGAVDLAAAPCTVPDGLEGMIPGLSFLPCTYEWDFGNGQTAEGEDPAPVTFATPGFYTVTMATTNGQGARTLTPAKVYVAVWEGRFTDDFNRPALDPYAHGWSEPLAGASVLGWNLGAEWSIAEETILHADHGDAMEHCQPGSQGMIAWPDAQNARVEVWQRHTVTAPMHPHYTDIILRMQYLGPTPSGPFVTYYRVRFEEHADTGSSCVQIDIFRITQAGLEYGINVNGEEGFYGMVCDWPDDRDLYVTAEIVGNTIHAEVADSAAPTVPLTSADYTDETADSLVQIGRFGVAQCAGDSYFDNFMLQSLD
jgi:PKD repeat protein